MVMVSIVDCLCEAVHKHKINMPDVPPLHYAELAPQTIFLLFWDFTIFVVTKKFLFTRYTNRSAQCTDI